jgi:adenylate kinase family enzyme
MVFSGHLSACPLLDCLGQGALPVVTGSGKTTLAARLAERTGLPFHCVDDLTWEPGWAAVPAQEQRRRIAEICARDSWILDHGYSSWIDLPLARADLIVGLDFPRWRSLSRLIWRTLYRGGGSPRDLQRQHRVVPAGVLERLDHHLALPVVREQASPDQAMAARSEQA